MKHIDAEKLKAEIEKNTPNHLMLMVYRDHILALIDSLQQEQQEEPDKSLEEAAEKSSAQYYKDAGYSPFPNVETAAHKSGFIAGAKWQAKRMKDEKEKE